MMHCSRTLIWILTFVAISALTGSAGAIEQGQVDDFEDGTTMGWREGAVSPNPPTNVGDGGPDGAGDNYLANQSSGSPNLAGGKMVMFNRLQWSGDYLAAGVNAITVKMANFGNAPLPMRIALNSSGDQWGSAEAIVLPDDGQWYEYTFRLTSAAMAEIFAIGTLQDALGAVSELRLLAAAAGPSWLGDAVVASIGIDDMAAVAVPIATGEASWSTVKSTYRD